MVFFLRTWRVCIVVVLLMAIGKAYAYSPMNVTGPVVSTISEVAGQPLTGLKAMVQDQSGFIWFATNEGLIRFDGQSLKRFEHRESEPNSLPDNDIRGIVEDEQGFLWLITRGGGLSRFNPQTEHFDNFRFDQNNPASIDSDQLNSLALGQNGVLWIGSNVGINRFDRNTLQNTRLNVQLQPQQAGVRDNIQQIFEDAQGRLWFSLRRKGLFLHTPQDGKISHFEHDEATPGSLDDNTVSEIFQSPEGVIWIGTALGINRFEESNQTFTTLTIPLKANNKVSHASVTRIFQDSAGGLWVATFYNGISRLKPGAANLDAFDDATGSNDSLSVQHVNDIYQDNSGTLWFVTPRSGVKKLRLEHLSVEHYQLRNKEQNIVALANDSQGGIWLATATAVFQQSNGQSPFSVVAEGFDAISAMAFWQNQLIIADRSKGVVSLGINGNGTELPAIGENILVLHVDVAGNLFAGTSKGLYRYQAGQNAWTQLFDSAAVRDIASNDNQLFLLSSQGVFYRTITGSRWRSIRDGALFESLYIDRQQQLWLSGQKGLFRLSQSGDSVESLEAFETITVSAMADDDLGHMWAATNEGVVRFNKTTDQYRLLTVNEGFRAIDFDDGFVTSLNNGELLMANNHELIRFNGQKVADNKQVFGQIGQILLSNFKLFNESRLPRAQDPDSPLLTTIDKTERLTLSHLQNWFSIDFASSDYRQPEELQYSYRMEELSEQWIDTIGGSQTASFTSLAPGEYTLLFRVSDASGAMQENIRSLKVIVTPPWWASNWAYALYGLAAMALIVLFNVVRTRQLRLRAAKLEAAIAERTVELQQRADTIAQLLEDKDALIANISHEFRTPLTLILGPLQSQLEQAKDAQSQALLALARANGKRLLNMVDQLLDMARMKDQPESKRQEVDVLQTCRVLVAQFEALTKAQDIELDMVENIDEAVFVRLQPDALEKILSNLLSNAVKYGSEGKYIGLAVSRREHHVVIEVCDKGRGMSEQDQRQIFERFVRLKNHADFIPGAGIGLALVKELVEQHLGEISVRSQYGHGSTFTVVLPLIEQPGPVTVNSVNTGLLEASAQAVEENARPKLEIQNPQDENLPSILVIEDNQDMRSYILSCINSRYHCFEAENGEAGVNIAREKLPDLIISDVMMPKMDGFAVTKSLKQDRATSHIPVILLTARGDSQSRLRGWAEKADEYLEKPFDTAELLARIDNLLSLRQLLRQRYQTQFIEQNNSPAKPETVKVAEQNLDDKQDSGPHQLFFNQVNDILAQHFADEHFDVAAFAQEMSLSHRQFGRKMKNLLDMTPAEALRNYRLQKAAELLKQGTTPSVACHQSGFSTHSYFSQCFKARFNCSPSEFVKQAS